MARLRQLRHPLALRMPPVRPTTAGLLPLGASAFLVTWAIVDCARQDAWRNQQYTEWYEEYGQLYRAVKHRYRRI
ncbi:MAG: hypothetical protein WC976_01690 [Caldisericia bacterium]